MGTQNFFFVPCSGQKEKNIFLYFFTELKIHHLSYFYLQTLHFQHADPSSMQDMCHMNFIIDLAHCGVSVAQW